MTLQIKTLIGLCFLGVLGWSDLARAESSCTASLGAKAVKILVDQCIQVSPATHPPCNGQNSCEMIRDEIKRGCDMLKSDAGLAPKFCMISPAPAPALAPAQAATPRAVVPDDMYSFYSPSQNINCLSSPGNMRCDIRSFTPSLNPPVRAANEEPDPLGECTAKAMNAFSIDAGAQMAQAFCPTDAPLAGEAHVLAYGAVLKKGKLTCTSEMAGMTCTNELGHGFFLSKAQQRIF